MMAMTRTMMILGKWPGNHLAWPGHGCRLEVPVPGVTPSTSHTSWAVLELGGLTPGLVTPGNRLGVGGCAIWPGCTQSYSWYISKCPSQGRPPPSHETCKRLLAGQRFSELPLISNVRIGWTRGELCRKPPRLSPGIYLL